MSIEELYKVFTSTTGASTDTRNIKQGCMFFALKGPTFNGNTYAAEALHKGAAYAVVDEKVHVINGKCILVDDVLTCLQQLAHYHRKQLGIPVIAICGSNGKTTTKELVFNVLNTDNTVFATPGNLNNHIGVPLSLLGIDTSKTHAVIEIGANHLGETAALCAIAAPDFGVITNNGYDHLEGYGSLENVRRANGELYAYLSANNGVAFVNADDDELMSMSANINRVTYGSHGDISGKVIKSYPFISVEWVKDNTSSIIQTNLAGDYNLPNVLCAICMGLYFGITREDINKGVEVYYPKNNRSQLIEKDTNSFIVDCYNANPSSMEVALKYFNNVPGTNKVVILGDMFELGSMSDALHIQVLTLAHALNFNKVVLVGPQFAKANVFLQYPYLTFNTTAEASYWLAQQAFTHTTFLLKASRGMALETLLK